MIGTATSAFTIALKGRPKVRLRGTPWTPEFMAQYDAAKGQPAPITSKGISPGTWRWLCVRYFGECADYLRLDERTRRVRRGILEATFDEPIAPGSSKFFRDFPLSRMTADAIEVLGTESLRFPKAQTVESRRYAPFSNGLSGRRGRMASPSSRITRLAT